MNELERFLSKLVKIIKAIIKQLLLIILYIVASTIFLNMFKSGIKSSNLLIGNLGYVLAEVAVLIVFILIFRKTLIPDYYDFKKNYRQYIKSTYKYYLIGLIIMIFTSNIISSFIGTATNEALIESYTASYPFYIIVTTILVAPIVEELLTRTAFKDCFKHSWIYIIISGLLFGALHISNLLSWESLYIISYGVLGCFLAKIYDKTNNIWTNIFFHSLHNLIAVVLMFITGV